MGYSANERRRRRRLWQICAVKNWEQMYLYQMCTVLDDNDRLYT